MDDSTGETLIFPEADGTWTVAIVMRDGFESQEAAEAHADLIAETLAIVEMEEAAGQTIQ